MAETDQSAGRLRDGVADRGAAGEPQPRPRIQVPPFNTELPVEKRAAELRRVATEVFAQTGSWVLFYREILGPGGVCQRLYPTEKLLRRFQATPEYAELQEMVAALRSQEPGKRDTADPERMITIRLPVSLHQSLIEESDELNLSVNKLCISKLLQPVNKRFVPVEKGRRRGRRPGPQGPRKPREESGKADEEQADR